MVEILMNVVVAAAILGASAWLTRRFTKSAYKPCAGCGALNAHRRTRCRRCDRPF